MSEKPILMSGPLVVKTIAGLKTQTRRVIRPQPEEVRIQGGDWLARDGQILRCPYGQPGDRLWVRETWRVGSWRDDGRMALDYAASPELVRTPWLWPPNFQHLAEQSMGDCERAGAKWSGGQFVWEHGQSPCRWRPSIHMPRWASRLTLAVESVRVERLQDISEEDARAEGINRIHHGDGAYYHHATRTEPHPKNWIDPVDAFRELWDSINAARPGCSWEANPFVWCVAFSVAEVRS